jgi:hypothetical protein
MKAYGVVDVEINVTLTSAIVGGQWSVSRPGRFIPPPPPNTHKIGVSLRPRTGLEGVKKRQILRTAHEQAAGYKIQNYEFLVSPNDKAIAPESVRFANTQTLLFGRYAPLTVITLTN